MRRLTLVVAGPAPQITTSALPNAQAGIPFQASLSAAGGVQPYHWSIAAGPLPSRLLLNAEAGVLLGTPSESGQFDFTVQVSDSSHPKPQTAMKALTLSVVALALQITSSGLPSGQVGLPFQAAVTATGGVAPYTWTVAGALPPGLSLNAASGAIIGTPMQSGIATFVIQLTDSVGQTTQKSFSIAIAATSAQPLAITTTALPQPVEGQAYSTTLQATGGTPPYTWNVASGQLPTGLTLVAAGQIAGTPTAEGQFSFTIQAADSASPPLTAPWAFSLTVADVSAPPGTDQYGGLLALPSPKGATGHWRVEKFGNRWLWVTPAGNGFWSFGVFDVAPDEHVDDLGATYKSRVIAKYGDADKTWGPQQVRRLRSWGFNTILDHCVSWVHPTQVFDGWPGDHTQPEKMAAVWFIDAGSYPVRFGGAKDIFQGVNTTHYNGYVAPNTDPFDPNFAAWINGYMASPGMSTLANHPWVMGFSSAESDYIWGFGAGSSADFPTAPPGHNSPQLGWIVLVTSPTQTKNSYWNLTYTDTKVYAKQALRDFLASRYGTITALNAAWSSSYTTFDSAGGWGVGSGLLDEDGRHPWIPNWDTLAGATPAMQKDLNDFLFLYAQQWFKTQRDALKSRFPNVLYLGPNVIGSWGTPPRKEILQAAGLYIDVFMTQIGSGSPDDQQRLDFTMQYLGDKPIASWIGIPANPDSSLFRYPGSVATQTRRGQNYNQMLQWFLNATGSSTVPGGAAGVKPYVGVRWWALVDNPAERLNWGLVSTMDNAYDGKEATVSGGTPGDIHSSTCKDPWGYPCGAEERNYGDFITSAKNAHLNLMRTLAAGKP